MPLEVIVADIPRSGTLSMREALIRLGFNKTMHMKVLMENPLLMSIWTEIYEKHLEKTWTSDDWRHMLDQHFPDYVATTDVPCCDFAVELAQAYPQAKIILLHRDPDKWLTSYQHLMAQFKASKFELFIISFLKSIHAHFVFEKFRNAWWRDIYNYPDVDKELMPFYVNKIKTGIDSERILEFKVQDSWAPLCKFLNKEIPEESFPHMNDAQALIE
ncbi:unnamed protein product [Rotaria sp. Silwood2]|nr:unnamed protein product [Rotaria sp. Silwood2]CAF4359439.1 unnamed protein product [Rotaria sp. Silwood2]